MKEIKEPLIILLVLFVLIGLAYGHKNPDANKSSNASTPSAISKSPNKDVAENIKTVEEQVKQLEANINNEIEKSKRSPYYGKIRMSRISGLHEIDPSNQYITLSAALKKNENVKITGWYLQSEVTGYYAIIGKASLLPFPFTRIDSDVVLDQGDKVYLIKGFSPIGISFRTNKCTGYFEENRTFVPSLPIECPLTKNEKLPTFSNDYDRNDECLKIIGRVPQCTTINSVFIRKLPDTVSDSCKTYLTEQINYNTCVALHFSNTDFPSNEYYVYLNKFGPLWRTTHDKINLRDQNGLIVDSISY